MIQANHLPPEVRDQVPGPGGSTDERYRAPGNGAEKDAIVRALTEAQGVRSRAAAILGMGRTTLWRKMREHGLDDPDGG